MANIIFDKAVDAEEKMALMRQDARFDVADNEDMVDADLSAIRRNIRSKKAPPTVPKVFLSNDCVFNCAYCGCRSGKECKTRYQSTPRELAELSVRQALRLRQGIFITSAIYKNSDYTQELIIETIRIIREELYYRGYIHAKVMPGADPLLIQKAGAYADRLSVNIEVAKSEGYSRIARNKNRHNILTPMGQISAQIKAMRQENSRRVPRFATSQTTQLMAGSTGEDDTTILRLSNALYKKYNLSRVYYTAFHYNDPAAGYSELEPAATPLWRVKRLYQADRLMQLYGYGPDELVTASDPNLREELDPKVGWALRNLHLFPVEVNTADYEMLLRIPGIGITYAKRILEARRMGTLTHDALKKLGISLGRSRHFITCNGRYTGAVADDPLALYNLLAEGAAPRQLSLAEGFC